MNPSLLKLYIDLKSKGIIKDLKPEYEAEIERLNKETDDRKEFVNWKGAMSEDDRQNFEFAFGND